MGEDAVRNIHRAVGVVVALFALAGCGRVGAPRYAEILGTDRGRTRGAAGAEAASAESAGKLRPPTGVCKESAQKYVSPGGRLLEGPLPEGLERPTKALLRGLHPVARRVLGRVHGVWYAEGLEGAAAVFLTCGVDERAARGGFILLDAGQFPFDRPVRDAEVPALYWRALSSEALWKEDDPLRRARGSGEVGPRDHAARYLVLHELGHALSLLAGEFILDEEQRMQIHGTSGFTGYSWALVTADAGALPGPGQSSTIRAVVPRSGLTPMTWGTLLDTIGADPDPLVPGYALGRPRRSEAALARDVCAGALGLVSAGFVTPTAARYPTEDYAEMFAHAILADEGKLGRGDRITLDIPGCGLREIGAPYFAATVGPKRAYLERALGLELTR